MRSFALGNFKATLFVDDRACSALKMAGFPTPSCEKGSNTIENIDVLWRTGSEYGLQFFDKEKNIHTLAIPKESVHAVSTTWE